MMWASIMDEIISQEPALSVRRTLDAKHYILNRWNENHDTPMDCLLYTSPSPRD